MNTTRQKKQLIDVRFNYGEGKANSFIIQKSKRGVGM